MQYLVGWMAYRSLSNKGLIFIAYKLQIRPWVLSYKQDFVHRIKENVLSLFPFFPLPILSKKLLINLKVFLKHI